MDNLRCGRQCEIINRPSYIVLFKGDDSDFEGNQSVDIVINTELDTTGMKAHFRFMDFVQDFNSIPENKTLNLVFPNAKTSEFPLGAADATLRFEDASGKFRTVSNRIHIVVTNSVHEAYDNEDSQSITVTVKGTVTWDMIEGKPDIPSEFPQPSDDEPLMDGEASAGESTEYSRGDHRHPSDTSKRNINDLGIRGEPQGAGSWFIVNGRQYNYDSGVWNNQYDSSFIDRPSETYRYNDGDQGIEFVFTLDNGVYTGGGYIIIGYVDTLAEVSQIPPPSSSTPLMDGTASHGSSASYSRGDHVHPHDAAKLDGAAAYPAWEDKAYVARSVVSYKGRLWRALANISQGYPDPSVSPDWEEVNINGLKQDALSSAQIGYINAVPNKADKAVPSAAGNLASLNAQGNLMDSGAKPSDFAAKSDLPYALVTPGEWTFSGVPEGVTDVDLSWSGTAWSYSYVVGTTGYSDTLPIGPSYDGNELSLTFSIESSTITATRASLPGHLLDRAGNLVVVTGDTTLTLPAANPGYLRDFLVRLEISGSTVPTITFAAPTGETITYETDGDEFPVPDEAGNWLYSFTEDCVAHTFAVSLKKVSVVTQGGV